MPSTEPRERPSPEQIAALPAYAGLGLAQIEVLRLPDQLASAERVMREAGLVGFDTESKPVFQAGQPHNGPDIIQFATQDRGFIVPLAASGVELLLRTVIEAPDILKVGFGLASDKPLLQRRLGLQLQPAVDLSHQVKRLGFKQAVGLKAAVAIVLGERLPKSKKTTTSNWASPTLSPQQLQYAANDAHASLRIYLALNARPRP